MVNARGIFCRCGGKFCRAPHQSLTIALRTKEVRLARAIPSCLGRRRKRRRAKSRKPKRPRPPPPAEGEEGEAGEGKAKKKLSGKTLILFIVLPAVLVLGGGGAAAYMLFFKGGGEQHAEAEAGHETRPRAAATARKLQRRAGARSATAPPSPRAKALCSSRCRKCWSTSPAAMAARRFSSCN